PSDMATIGLEHRIGRPLRLSAVYLHTAGKYSRLTWPTLTGAKRPRGEGSHGIPAGSVANIAQGAMQGQLPLSGWGLSSQGVEQFGRSEALVSGLHHHLSFLNHVHEFDSHQGVLGCVERFEPQHGPCHPLHCSMILLHNVV